MNEPKLVLYIGCPYIQQKRLKEKEIEEIKRTKETHLKRKLALLVQRIVSSSYVNDIST